MSIVYLNSEVSYGLVRYYKGGRLYNEGKLNEFNRGKIKAKELVTFDCALMDLYEITKDQIELSLNDSEQVVAIIVRPGIEKEYYPDNDPLFEFCGYDLVETETRISAITNCGACFGDAIDYDSLNGYGLISTYRQAVLTQLDLADKYPEESHACTDVVEIWRRIKQ